MDGWIWMGWLMAVCVYRAEGTSVVVDNHTKKPGRLLCPPSLSPPPKLEGDNDGVPLSHIKISRKGEHPQ